MDGAEIISFLLWVSCILCVYVFVRSVVCAYVHVHVCIYIWRPEVNVRGCLLHLMFEAGFIREPRTDKFGQARWPASPQDLLCMPPHPAFHMGTEEPNLDLDGCTTGILPN